MGEVTMWARLLLRDTGVTPGDLATVTGCPKRNKGGVCAPFRQADDGTRTHDTWLGKPVLYQLSYVRATWILLGF